MKEGEIFMFQIPTIKGIGKSQQKYMVTQHTMVYAHTILKLFCIYCTECATIGVTTFFVILVLQNFSYKLQILHTYS
jgi:hypothetical protein